MIERWIAWKKILPSLISKSRGKVSRLSDATLTARNNPVDITWTTNHIKAFILFQTKQNTDQKNQARKMSENWEWSWKTIK